MFDVLFYGLKWKSSEHMLRDDNILISQRNMYRDELIRAVKKMNIEQPELMEKNNTIDPIT
jgi:hypothetical protein